MNEKFQTDFKQIFKNYLEKKLIGNELLVWIDGVHCILYGIFFTEKKQQTSPSEVQIVVIQRLELIFLKIFKSLFTWI